MFAAESFTQCPLTTDHTVLLNLFKDVQPGIIQDGTAIGLGLANAVSRIKDSQAKSKVIILLTDGVNNQGEIAPVTAAEVAKTSGPCLYRRCLERRARLLIRSRQPSVSSIWMIDVEIDEPTLKQIAGLRPADSISVRRIMPA